MKSHSCFIVGLLLFSFSLVGCKPRQPESSESRPSQPRHFKKTTGEPENFNRDIHVLRELWKEVAALDPANEDQAEKHRLLLNALREKVVEIEPMLPNLPESDRALVHEIQAYLNIKVDENTQ